MRLTHCLSSLASGMLLLICGCTTNFPVVEYAGQIDPAAESFVVCGDIQDRIWFEVWREDTDAERRLVLDRIAAEQPAFVLQVGDLVGKGSCASKWRQLDRDLSALRQRGVPLLPLLGNHDYMGSNKKALRNYFNRFSFLEGRKWYGFTQRGVRFLMLDSNDDELTDEEVSAQLSWLAAEIAAADADESVRAVVLATHHPPYTNAYLIPASSFVRERVLPVALGSSKLRLVLSGHVHSYERFVRDGVQYVVTGGGGAPQNLNGVAGPDGAFADLYDGPRGFHYLKARLTAGRLVFEVVMLDREAGTWSPVDSFEIALD